MDDDSLRLQALEVTCSSIQDQLDGFTRFVLILTLSNWKSASGSSPMPRNRASVVACSKNLVMFGNPSVSSPRNSRQNSENGPRLTESYLGSMKLSNISALHALEAQHFTVFADHKPLTHAFTQKKEKLPPVQMNQLSFIS
ncbi:hypothetical protein BC332_34716 [Capsicum chinense]|nr:hypothetical protein BC332_34716 [Capsicum chinense]